MILQVKILWGGQHKDLIKTDSIKHLYLAQNDENPSQTTPESDSTTSDSTTDSLANSTSVTQNADRTKNKKSKSTKPLESITLERQVVTASGFEQDYTLAPASISVVTPEEIQTRPVRDLAEAISNVPGVNTDSRVTKMGGYNISIRGMPAHYTLILVDGKRVNGGARSVLPNSFDDAVTNFMPPLSAIERIEVIRGPASTLYGSDAIGGVVNIITKKRFDKWVASVGYDSTFQEKTPLAIYIISIFIPQEHLIKQKIGG